MRLNITLKRFSLSSKQKRPLTFLFGDSAYLFLSMLNSLPIKDTLSLYGDYLYVGFLFFILFNLNPDKSQQKSKSSGLLIEQTEGKH
jgi:hypothetical protein